MSSFYEMNSVRSQRIGSETRDNIYIISGETPNLHVHIMLICCSIPICCLQYAYLCDSMLWVICSGM